MEFSRLSVLTANLVLISVFSIPGIIDLATQLQTTRPNTQLYEDEDGETTPDAVEAYSDRVPKIIMALCSFLGMCIALASVILAIKHMHTGFIGPLLILATWVCNASSFNVPLFNKTLTVFNLYRLSSLSK